MYICFPRRRTRAWRSVYELRPVEYTSVTVSVKLIRTASLLDARRGTIVRTRGPRLTLRTDETARRFSFSDTVPDMTIGASPRTVWRQFFYIYIHRYDTAYACELERARRLWAALHTLELQSSSQVCRLHSGSRALRCAFNAKWGRGARASVSRGPHASRRLPVLSAGACRR